MNATAGLTAVTWYDGLEAPRWTVEKDAKGYCWAEWPLDDDLTYVTGEQVVTRTDTLDPDDLVRGWPWSAAGVEVEGIDLDQALALLELILPRGPRDISFYVKARSSGEIEDAYVSWDGGELAVDR